jgi:hypothetical protein
MSDIVKFGSAPSVVVTHKETSEETRTTVTVKATSILTRDIFVQVSVAPQAGSQAGWFTIPDSLLRFQVMAGRSFDVPVTVKIPAGTPFDKYGFKVLAADDAAPEKDFTDTTVVIDRRQGAVEHKSWWKWVAAGIGVVAVAIIAVLLLRGPSWLDHCKPGDGNCPPDGRCPAEVEKCLAPRGTACKVDDVCLSGKCRDQACAPAGLGDPCHATEPACEGDERIGCFGKSGKCVSLQGGPCRTVADCFDGACTRKDGNGPLTCGKAINQANCEPAKSAVQCPADQECLQSGERSACLYKGGALCPKLSDDDDKGGPLLCVSQRCNDIARCAPSDGSCVAKNHDCAPSDDCVAGHCKPRSGGQVKVNIDWTKIDTAAIQVLARKRASSEEMILLQKKKKTSTLP